MPRDWREIETDEILNFEGPQTGAMARYDRIMRQKEIEAMLDVRTGLFDLQKAIDNSSENLNKKIDEFDEAQGKLQKITIALTIVIAFSTVAYTYITWQSVNVQREANQIQKSQLERQNHSAKTTPSNKSLQPTAESGG